MTVLPSIHGTYTAHKPLAGFTTINVGGMADYFATFADWDDLAHFMRENKGRIPLTLIGQGSNMVISDDGIEGVVTQLGSAHGHVVVDGNRITAFAGATCGKVARAARDVALTGLEFFGGIPGSVGGALKMNAGAYSHETRDNIVNVCVLTDRGEEKILTPEECHFSYRRSLLPPGWLFKSVTFALEKGDKNTIRARMREINRARAESQPLNMPSSGSWFKNPVVNGVKRNAWHVVDEAGCRGMYVGHAQVSEKHCNFFINLGKAKAADFMALSDKVHSQVKERLAIDLQREVRFIGRGYEP